MPASSGFAAVRDPHTQRVLFGLEDITSATRRVLITLSFAMSSQTTMLSPVASSRFRWSRNSSAPAVESNLCIVSHNSGDETNAF